MNALLLSSVVFNVIILILLALVWKRTANTGDSAHSAQMSTRLESLDQGLSRKFTELAVQLERTRGELNHEITKQFSDGLSAVRIAVDSQLTQGRSEQAASLTQAI